MTVGLQLAERNVGRLLAPTDDSRVAGFMAAYGDSDQAFGRNHLADARLWRTRACNAGAAE